INTRKAHTGLPGVAFYTENNLLRTASRACGSALRLAFRLQNHAVKRSRPQESAVNNTHAAQRVARIGPTLPGATAVCALEDHACLHAGGEQTLAVRVIHDRGDVLVGQAGQHVRPGCTIIGAFERALTGCHEDVGVGRNSNTTDIRDVLFKAMLRESSSAVGRNNDVDRSRCHNCISLATHGEKILLPLHRTAHPNLALVLAEVETVRSGSHPAIAGNLDVIHARIEHRASAGLAGNLSLLRPLL